MRCFRAWRLRCSAAGTATKCLRLVAGAAGDEPGAGVVSSRIDDFGIEPMRWCSERLATSSRSVIVDRFGIRWEGIWSNSGPSTIKLV